MNQTYEITIENEFDGTRIDLVLSLLLEGISRSYIVRLIEQGLILINGNICDSKKLKLKAGDIVHIEVPEPSELKIEAQNIPLDIVYEDDEVLVVNKPKGMVVHPAPGNYDGTLVNAIMYHCGDRLSSINGVVRPGIVHRIDKDTSGILVIAKTDNAHEKLSAQFAEHSITRNYMALVYNGFNEDEGTVDAPLGRDPKNRLRMAVTDLNSKRAVTHYKVLERLGKYTLVNCKLETGRTHQIRVHLAHIKHPVVGDLLYGPKNPPKDSRLGSLATEGQLLHAYRLGFIHPSTGEYMEFEAKSPDEFEALLTRLRG